MHTFSVTYEQLLLGGASIDVHGVPLTEETIATAKQLLMQFLWVPLVEMQRLPHGIKLEPSKRPEAGLLAIRKALNLFAKS